MTGAGIPVRKGGEDVNYVIWKREPRPEFALGCPNPVLVAFRERAALDPNFEHNSMWAQAEDALEVVKSNRLDWWRQHTGGEVTAEHLDHAATVLTRLAALAAAAERKPAPNPLEPLVAQALWFSDMTSGAISTHWNDLGEIGQDANRKDAAGVLRAFDATGISLIPTAMLSALEAQAKV